MTQPTQSESKTDDEYNRERKLISCIYTILEEYYKQRIADERKKVAEEIFYDMDKYLKANSSDFMDLCNFKHYKEIKQKYLSEVKV